jgi:hypothetical protein
MMGFLIADKPILEWPWCQLARTRMSDSQPVQSSMPGWPHLSHLKPLRPLSTVLKLCLVSCPVVDLQHLVHELRSPVALGPLSLPSHHAESKLGELDLAHDFQPICLTTLARASTIVLSSSSFKALQIFHLPLTAASNSTGMSTIEK